MRWVRAEPLHVTLCFLGDLGAAQIDLVIAAARDAAASSRGFDVAVAGLGVFPNARRPRVLWAGVTDGGVELTGLRSELIGHLARGGLAVDDSHFTPHVTLGRVGPDASRADCEKIAMAIEARGDIADPRAGSMMNRPLRPSDSFAGGGGLESGTGSAMGRPPRSSRFVARKLTVMESVLGREGSRYVVIERSALSR